MDYQIVLGGAAVLIGIVGYIPYFRNILAGLTKPHAFSWLVWGILTAIAFAGQVISNGGAGAWVTGFTALVCFLIFILALQRGSRDFPLLDWLSLGGAFLGLVLWALTNNPLTAIVLVTLVDLLGFIPTFRKSFSRPSEETMFTYAMSGLKFALGIAALKNLALVNILYPASLVLTNGLFVIMLAFRRRAINH